MGTLATAALEVVEKSQTETRPADLSRARELDERISPSRLLDRCRDAVRVATPRASMDERDDLTSELVEHIGKRDGWNPPLRRVGRSFLIRRAQRIAADRTNWRDQVRRPDTEPTDEWTPDAGSMLAHAASLDIPYPDCDAERITEAEHLDRDESAALTAALSGYGSALELAKALGLSHDRARHILADGRRKLRQRWTPGELADVIADTDAEDPDPDRIRPRLDAAQRAARALLDRMAPTVGTPHAATHAPEPRTSGPEHEARTVVPPSPTRARAVLAYIAHAPTAPGWVPVERVRPRERMPKPAPKWLRAKGHDWTT